MMKAAEYNITERLKINFEKIENAFGLLTFRDDLEHKIEEIREAKPSRRGTLLRDLTMMFNDCGIIYDLNKCCDPKTGLDYCQRLVEESDLSDSTETKEDMILYVLYSCYQQYPSPRDYMKRIVGRLSSAEDDWKSDTLRLQILKQFVKYGNCLSYKCLRSDNDGGTGAGQTEKLETVTLYGGRLFIKAYLEKKTGKRIKNISDYVNDIEDDVFDVLKPASDNQKKPNGRYGLLRMVDDISKGKFRGEDVTKRSLYLFAMVYGMSYSPLVKGDDIRDIEKNLFRDYYANNIIRFISGDLNETNARGSELDPSGQGINFKNYQEMIYLYCISKNGLSPLEKIKLSSEMIRKAEKLQRSNTVKFKGEEKTTSSYRELFNEKVSESFELDEKQFLNTICSYYICDPRLGLAGSHSKADMQETAYQNYKRIMQKLLKELSYLPEDPELQDDTDIAADKDEKRELLANLSYGLFFADIPALNDDGYAKVRDRYWKRISGYIEENRADLLDKKAFDDFFSLLSVTGRFCSDRRFLRIDSPEDITRTSMIIAYYYYFNVLNDEEENIGFKEVFESFSGGVNKYLEDSYYQPLNIKNIFDIYIAVSAYASINL